MAESEPEVSFDVSALSGRSATLRCAPTATLGSLAPLIAKELGLDAAYGLRCFRSAGSDYHLPDSALASELASGSIVVVANSEPQWCSDQCFTMLAGTSRGGEDESCETRLEIHAGGRFVYNQIFTVGGEDDDDEDDFEEDITDADGTWKVEKTDDDELLVLEGVSKKRSCRRLGGPALVCSTESLSPELEESSNAFHMTLWKSNLLESQEPVGKRPSPPRCFGRAGPSWRVSPLK
ncbi:unnamed protein product [Effrenium voratum]|nr:unnamed protein product [Effrenium voratum]